jgi:hypothetical protein
MPEETDATGIGSDARMPNLSFSQTKSSRRSGQSSALQNGYAETAANKVENMNDVILSTPAYYAKASFTVNAFLQLVTYCFSDRSDF